MKKLISLVLVTVMICTVISSLPVQGMFNIDRIFVNDNTLTAGTDVKDYDLIETEVGDRLFILGWAYGSNSNLKEIVYSIDDGEDISCPGSYRDRPDVAAFLGLDYSFGMNAGFGIDNNMLELSGIDQLGDGTYVLLISALYNDGTRETKDYNLKVGTGVNGERRFGQIEPDKLNIVIDGGTELNEAAAGSTVDVKIRLVNNETISSLKAQIRYDSALSVVLDGKGKPVVTYGIYDPDDDSAMKGTVLNAEENYLILNWISGEDEVTGDTDFATVTFKIADDAEPGSFLPITAVINPSDVFDIEQNDIEFNLINGGIDVAAHDLGDPEYDGYYHWRRCLDCGEIFEYGAHTFEDHTIYGPTCTEYGMNERVCTVCGYSETYYTEPSGHKLAEPAELSEIEDGLLNVVIDGGASLINADPGEIIDVKIRLVNNDVISSLKMVLHYDENLSVVLDGRGKPCVTFDIIDPDDDSAMKATILDEQSKTLLLNWLSAESDVKGDTVYATVRFKVSEYAVPGSLLPIIADINPNDVFANSENDYIDLEFNLINGGVYVGDIPEEYEHDDFGHWHVCVRCGETIDYENHTDADHDTLCDICGHTVGIKGDTNNDGLVNNKDVVVLFRYVTAPTGDANYIAFDFNEDGYINNRDVVALFRYLTVPPEQDVEPVILQDDGTLSGKVCKASDRITAIPGASIDVYRNGSLYRSLTSDGNGNYVISLSAGQYYVEISAAGYIVFRSYANVTENTNTYMETFLMIEGSEDMTGAASGRVINSLTGEPEPGVTLTFRKDWSNSNENAETLAETVTDSNGYYYIELPLGNYTVVANKDGSLTSMFNIIIQAKTTSNQNGTITPFISGADYLITLTWGENPSDLDSHVEGRLSNGGTFHVFYGYKSQYDGGVEVCNLDYDDTTSYGPEHITLNCTTNDAYYYYIYRYAGSGSVATSGAKVTVHHGNTLLAEFNVPTNLGTSDYWNVFAIKNGQLIIRNTITSYADTGYAG